MTAVDDPLNADAQGLQAAVDVPLCVDLDGTLLRTDTLLEAILRYLRHGLLHGLKLCAWLLRGRAVLKEEIARSVPLDVSRLPVNEELLAWLRAEHGRGRRLLLCTAAPESYARSAVTHFGLFNDVLSSDRRLNLSGHAKGARLAALFGEGGFDYAGNAVRDLAVWRHARSAIVVTPTLPLAMQMRRVPRVTRVFERTGGIGTWLRALRPHQWAKNVLVFMPAVGAHLLFDSQVMSTSFVAFAVFCLAASGTYVVNDLLDLDADRGHPTKRARPMASGSLQITEGAAAAVALIGASLVIGYTTLGSLFLLTLCGYIVATFWYSLDLKQRAGADILCLAGLYTLRIIAGSAATLIEPSFWLLAFSMFLFLSLAAAKRSTELGGLQSRSEVRAPGRGYAVSDLPLLLGFGVAAAYSSVLVLALYVYAGAETLYSNPKILWLLCPVFLYWVSRVWLKTHRRQLHEDPVVFALTDRPSQVVAIAFVAIVWLAT